MGGACRCLRFHLPHLDFSCVDINAKNTYGGYTGWQTHLVAFKNGSVELSRPDSTFCNREGDVVVERPAFGLEIVGQ